MVCNGPQTAQTVSQTAQIVENNRMAQTVKNGIK
jgi:hypothetical protein